MTTKASRSARRFVPPVIVLVALVALPQVAGQGDRDAAPAPICLEQIRSAIESAPVIVGDWIGRDIDMPPSAVELLRPTAVLSRQFVNVRTSALASLLVVHCSDARDMGGHYPPRCYPAQGWVRDEGREPDRVEVAVGERRIPMRTYRFRRGPHHDEHMHLRVYNFFVESDGTTSAERPPINHVRESIPASARGVAQVQVLTPGDMDGALALSAAADILAGHTDVLAALGQGAER